MKVGALGLDECPGTPMWVRSGIAAFVEIGSPLVARARSRGIKVFCEEGKRNSVFHRPGRRFCSLWLDYFGQRVRHVDGCTVLAADIFGASSGLAFG